MSNHLAIATVTATLGRHLFKDAGSVASDVSMTYGRPTDPVGDADASVINVYLYQVMPNAAFRNADLPSRRNDGSMTRRPRVALDLHYLLTFYGRDAELTPQRLLGHAARLLHAHPVLTPKMIQAAIAENEHLRGANLDRQFEKVKITPMALNLEELTKLWSVFFQTPHALSAAYQASLVLIEAEESIQRSLPVRKRGVYMQPFRQPMIERITSRPPRPPGGAEYAGSPILMDHTLIIEGKRLRGESTKVGFGEVEVTPPDPASIRNTRIELPLSSPPFPAGSLRAGVKDARIIHPVMMGESSEPHGGVESNLGAFVLRPTITVAPFIDGNEIEVKFDPPVWKKQRVSLLLNELDLPPDDRKARAYWFDAPENNGITDGSVTKTKVIRFPISGVKNGDYLVRVRVDRAESPLQIKDGRYKKPKVTIQ